MTDLKIKVEILAIDLPVVSQWVQEFNEKCDFRCDDASIEGDTLIINAYDISKLVGASQFSAHDEMALYRLKKSAIGSMQVSLKKRKNALVIRALNSALETLNDESPANAGFVEQMLMPRPLEKLPHV